MSRFFEVVELVEETPQFLIVGESSISSTLVENLLSGDAQVYFLSSSSLLSSEKNLYKISKDQLSNIPESIQYVFIEKEQSPDFELMIHSHAPHAKYIYLNPRSLKKDAIMIFSPLIYGPGITDEAFGFLAMNSKSIINDKTLIFPDNLTEEIAPVYFSDVATQIEKAMFTMSSIDHESLFLLSGPEKISLSAFLGGIKARLKFDLEIKYLNRKLTFRMPEAGRNEIGQTTLAKGMDSMIDFLTKNLIEAEGHKMKDHDVVSEPLKIVPKIIPAASPIEENVSDFQLDKNLLRNIYRDNIEYLEKNKLIKDRRFDKKSSSIKTSIVNKINKFKNLCKKNLFFRFKRPKLKKILLLILFPLFPLFLTHLFFVISVVSTKVNVSALLNGDLRKSNVFQALAYRSFQSTKFLNSHVSRYYFFIDQKSQKNFSALISYQEDLLQATDNINKFYQNISISLPYILDKSKVSDDNVFLSFENSGSYLEASRNNVASLIAKLKNEIPSLPFYLGFAKDEYFNQIKQLSSYYEDLEKANLVVKAMPEILGENSKKTYAIIFQNNMELRSTGGFIGSFALITFEKYKLLDFSVYDVYDADGQLKGHVKPPPEILHYLKQPDFFLRDSNVSPNFVETAEKISWFLAKEMRVKLDGVFAIDISFVEKLLDVTGPLYLSDFKETVTSSNLFEKAERRSEVNFFPGSTNKKDFLSILGKNLWQKILVFSKEDALRFMKVVQSAIETRHFQMYFENPLLSSVPAMLSADGQLKNVEGEYVDVIENNYGANKANYFVKRTFDHLIEIQTDGFVHHRLNISYSNFSPVSMWPTGDYKPYVKIYVNNTSLFKDFSYENKKIKLSEFLNEFVLEELKADTEQLVLQGEENNKKYFGTFITVPVGKTKSLSFSWQNSNYNPTYLTDFSYYFQKQAGVISDDYYLKIKYPSNLSVRSNLVPSVDSEGVLEYNLNTERDIDLQLKFR